MYNREQIEDSLEFCQDIDVYYRHKTRTSDFRKQDYVFQPQPSSQQDTYEWNDDILNQEAHGFLYQVVSLALCVILAVAITHLITNYIFTFSVVDGTSMQMTLQDKDLLVVNRLVYNHNDPKRFDVIVFEHAKDDYYVKRIIGLPGETVQIEDQNIYINGELLEEDYGSTLMLTEGNAINPIHLGEEEYFVLGDNRQESFDSRYSEVGLIQKSTIIGKASIRVWPWNKIRMLTN